MDSFIATQLVALNRRFYADFGQDFSVTRGRIQPGVRRVISILDGTEQILDLGCGNGELARTLVRQGQHGSYLGLDFSLSLLKDAERQPEACAIKFQLADLTAVDWDSSLKTSAFSIVFCFAVLHHIPGLEMRLNILQKTRALLAPAGSAGVAPGGKFIHSEWQFLNSPKLRARIQPWERVNLSAADVDTGDYLLDWRSGGTGLRYVHHFSEQELSHLAAESGFRVVETFLSDGNGGRLGLYQLWEAA